MRISDWSSDVCSSDLIGAAHLDVEPARFAADSPFDYALNREVLIVTDIKRGDLAALSGASSRLIEAAGGVTLGLFTAIQRRKSVYAPIAAPRARAGLPISAQTVDPTAHGTCVDIFRNDTHAPLHGKVATRYGGE